MKIWEEKEEFERRNGKLGIWESKWVTGKESIRKTLKITKWEKKCGVKTWKWKNKYGLEEIIFFLSSSIFCSCAWRCLPVLFALDNLLDSDIIHQSLSFLKWFNYYTAGNSLTCSCSSPSGWIRNSGIGTFLSSTSAKSCITRFVRSSRDSREKKE